MDTFFCFWTLRAEKEPMSNRAGTIPRADWFRRCFQTKPSWLASTSTDDSVEATQDNKNAEDHCRGRNTQIAERCLFCHLE